jgi:hypothetical protein
LFQKSSDAAQGRNAVVIASALAVKLAKKFASIFKERSLEIGEKMDVDVKDGDDALIGDNECLNVVAFFVKYVLSIPVIIERWISSWKMVSVVDSILSQDADLWKFCLINVASAVSVYSMAGVIIFFFRALN